MPKTKEICKNLKKFLTNETCYGILKKLCDERQKSGVQHHIEKNLKNFEKVLDKFRKM